MKNERTEGRTNGRTTEYRIDEGKMRKGTYTEGRKDGWKEGQKERGNE